MLLYFRSLGSTASLIIADLMTSTGKMASQYRVPVATQAAALSKNCFGNKKRRRKELVIHAFIQQPAPSLAPNAFLNS
jgi:hypothetical protein